MLTGAFGSGKSSMAAEIADLVEGKQPYAAIDLDWLAWFDAMDGSPDPRGGPRDHRARFVGFGLRPAT
jgi:hypothetical protein